MDKLKFLNAAIIFLWIFTINMVVIEKRIDLSFQHLGVPEGLSSDETTCVFKDNLGYLWIGTQNGLSRYDGYSVNKWYNDPSNPESLPSNEISFIKEDFQHQLWIGTSKGICVFDRKKNIFFTPDLGFTDADSYHCQSMLVENDSTFWVASQKGLLRFNKQNNTYKWFLHNPDLPYSISSIIKYKDFFYLGSWNHGLIKFNPVNGKVISSYPLINNSNASQTLYVSKLYLDSNNLLWVGSHSRGLKILDLKTETYTVVPEIFRDKISISDICPGGKSIYWIATDKGLCRYNRLNGKIEFYKTNGSDPEALPSNILISLYPDSNGIMYISTFNKGIGIYNPNRIKFPDIFAKINKSIQIANRSVKSIYINKAGCLCIGTDYGLNIISRNNESLRTYTYSPSVAGSIGEGGVTCMFEDSAKHFWLGTWGGSWQQFLEHQQSFRKYAYAIDNIEYKIPLNPKILADQNITTACYTSSGQIWIGTVFGFLIRFFPETDSFQHFHFSTARYISSIVANPETHTVWFSSTDGLYKVSDKTGKYTIYRHASNNKESISDSKVLIILKAENGFLWIGTNSGLDHFNIRTGTFEHIIFPFPFKNIPIQTIQQDNDGNLWLGTSTYLVKYNPANKESWYYNSDEGILQNLSCSYKGPDGTLYFGGINGLIALNPAEIPINTIKPNVVFTGLKIFNQPIMPGSPEMVDAIDVVDGIKLSYKQNEFEISFAALNFTLQNKNQFAYLLQGLNSEWFNIGNQNFVKFANIPPGDYVLRVKACNNDGLWNDQGASLKITIVPPIWKTWWFRLIILIVTLFCIVLWANLRTQNLIKRKKKLELIVKQRTAELKESLLRLQSQQKEIIDKNEEISLQRDLMEERNEQLVNQQSEIIAQLEKEEKMALMLHEADQARIRFFLNISHEFRTPLTLILSPLEKALEALKNNQLVFQQIDIAKRNAHTLLKLINQILDISKLETGNMQLQTSRMDIVGFVNQIFHSFDYIIAKKSIHYTFTSSQKSKIFEFDPDKVEKIISNILANAVKFTPHGGTIELSLQTTIENEIEYVEISVTDTGIGIPSDKIDKIFDRFYQANEEMAVEGTGIGLSLAKELAILHQAKLLVESEPGKGSTFVMLLPVVLSESFSTEHLSDAVLPKEVPLAEPFNNIIMSHEPSVESGDESERPLLLIAEDNEDLRSFLAGHFSETYRVLEATDGEKAFEIALREIPDFIVSDVMMPKMNGLILCRKIKEHNITCHIPVLLLTVQTAEFKQMEGFKIGADDYIAKPFNLNILALKIKNILITRNNLRQKFLHEIKFETSDIAAVPSDQEFINKLINLIEMNISKSDFNFTELIDASNMSKSHFYRKLKALSGQSPSEFTRTIRLKKAIKYLETNNYTVSEIIHLTGFTTRSYFYKSFIEQFGISPKAYLAGKKDKSS